jgi:hypothetical protein
LEPEINIWIRRAEDSWLQVLVGHAEKLSRNTELLSHDHSHHIRVWNLCKSLMREVSSFSPGMDPSLVEGVLIASLFHDLGMAISIREDHGSLSRENCEQWFRQTGRDLPDRYEEILRAIELHDRKDEDIYGAFEPGNTPDILALLSVADDLEALGTIGIFRYAEIYLMRGIPLEELGTRVLDNVRIRFGKLAQACLLCPELLGKYRKEFVELCDFYEEYNLQLKSTSVTDRVSSGPLGVINYISEHGPDSIDPEGKGKELSEFVLRLKNELEQARL